ncbi:MAG TPA: hypothetical protein VGN98_09055 [Tianweitania sediminis]|nr:hypothetical protein [Tianweitania sediminis]
MIVLHDVVESGLSLAGKPVSGTQELAVRSQHHPRARLLTPCESEAMGGQPPTQFGAGGRVGTGGTDIFAHNGEVDPSPLRSLMLGAGKGGGGAFSLTQMHGKPGGYVDLAFGTQGGEDGQVMRPGNNGMAEQDFELAGDLLMPGAIKPGG